MRGQGFSRRPPALPAWPALASAEALRDSSSAQAHVPSEVSTEDLVAGSDLEQATLEGTAH